MDLKHVIPQQRRRTYGPSVDIQFSADKSGVPRVGPATVFTRASSGTFVNENRIIVGKTTSTTSLNPASVAVGGVAVFEVPSGSVVGWLNNSVVVVMEDTDGDDQIGAQRHVTGTLIHKTDTAITLLVTSKVGTTTLSSWFVSYRGLRIGHDPVTGKCYGYLQETSRTNLLRNSGDLMGAGWILGAGSARTPSQPSPDGQNNAILLYEDTTTGLHRLTTGPSASKTSGTTYTISIYAKANSTRNFSLNAGILINAGAIFNLVTGTIVSNTQGTAQIVNAGNGWWRCSITGTATTTGTGSMFFDLAVGGTLSYTGDGSSGIFLWGGQMEAGSDVTSLILTGGTSAVRVTEVFTVPSISAYNNSEGTMFAVSQKFTVNSNPIIFRIFSTDSVDFRYGNEGLSSLVVANVGGVNQAVGAGFNIGGFTLGSSVKTALALQLDNYGFSVNGSNAIVDTTANMPEVTTFQVGSNLNGFVSGVKYFRNRLSNAQLKTLTAIVSDTIVYNGVAIWYNGVGLIETN